MAIILTLSFIKCFVLAVRYVYASRFRLRVLTKNNQNLGSISPLLLFWMDSHFDSLNYQNETAKFANIAKEQTFRFTSITYLNDTLCPRLIDRNQCKKFFNISEFGMNDFKETINFFKHSIEEIKLE